jgi:hypothetical protein
MQINQALNLLVYLALLHVFNCSVTTCPTIAGE